MHAFGWSICEQGTGPEPHRGGFRKMFLKEPFSMSTAPALPPIAEPSDHGPHMIERIFLGPQGLRAGWSVLLGYGLFYLFRMVIGTVYLAAHLVSENSSFDAV